MSAETSGQLICRGVGQNVSPRERTDISSVDKEDSRVGRVMCNISGMSLLLALVLLTC